MSAFCTSCGAPLKAENRFCTQCGGAVKKPNLHIAPEALPAPSPPPVITGAGHAAKNPRARGPLGAIVAVLVAGLAGGAAFWILREQPLSRSPVKSVATAPVATPNAPVATQVAVQPPPVSAAPDPVATNPPAGRQESPAPAEPKRIAAPTGSPAPARGVWMLSSDSYGVQLLFKGSRAAEDATIRFVCNRDDGVVWIVSRAVLDHEVEALAGQAHGLDMTISGGGGPIVARGYPASAPGETVVAWEISRSLELMRAFAAPRLAIRAPGLSIGRDSGDNEENLSAFSQACPPVAGVETDPLGWGTQTNRGYGYRLDIPKGLLRLAAGDRFARRYVSDADDAELIVQNHVNATGQPLALAIADETPKLGKVVYQRRAHAFVAISGYAADRIVYYKARSTCGGANIVSFTLTYKAELRGTYDPIAERMSKSFDRTTSADGTLLCP